jgi:GAF domain-containing protein
MGAKIAKKPRNQRKGRAAVPIDWANEAPFPVPIPKDEPERVAELHNYEILDTLPEDIFDNITILASHICETPIAMVTLVDSDRQWFKSKVGISAAETSRDIAFCAHAIMEDDLFVVPDAAADKRFARNPLVLSHPKIRFYAGAPLITPHQHALGTLCVIDRVPRQLTKDQLEALRALSRAVMAQLETRREIKHLQRRLKRETSERIQLSRQLSESKVRRRSHEEGVRRLSHEVRATNKAILSLVDQTLTAELNAKCRKALKSVRSLAQSLVESAK